MVARPVVQGDIPLSVVIRRRFLSLLPSLWCNAMDDVSSSNGLEVEVSWPFSSSSTKESIKDLSRAACSCEMPWRSSTSLSLLSLSGFKNGEDDDEDRLRLLLSLSTGMLWLLLQIFEGRPVVGSLLLLPSVPLSFAFTVNSLILVGG